MVSFVAKKTTPEYLGEIHEHTSITPEILRKLVEGLR